MQATTITDAMNWRVAVQKFDTSKKLRDEDVTSLIDIARLAPSSFGIEPWHFVVVTNPEVRAQLLDAAGGQAKVAEASHLVVITHRTNPTQALEDHLAAMMATSGKTREELSGYEASVTSMITSKSDAENTIWLAKQNYIALGTLIEAAALMGIDAAPMEGFDAAAVDTILGLPEKGLHVTTFVALGHRHADDVASARKKVRRPLSEVMTVVS
jgi:nitroreductase